MDVTLYVPEAYSLTVQPISFYTFEIEFFNNQKRVYLTGKCMYILPKTSENVYTVFAGM